MWFKQIKLFQLTDALKYSTETFIKQLEELAFRPCLPSMMQSSGWVSPIEEENAPLAQILNGNIMLCLQIEEKILPAIVIRQELTKKIKEIESSESRKVGQKQKLSLKDEITMTLLPRAFTKLTRIYAYIDTKNHWLVIGTTNENKIEQLISMFKKSVTENVHPYKINKLGSTLTYWLKNQNYPSLFSIEKACVLHDPNQKNRIIRCQQQDLFANAIQALIKDGCEVKQLALSWQDRINLVLSDDFSLSGIKYEDEITRQASDMEAETIQQQFCADFFVMTETLTGLFTDLLNVFIEPSEMKKIEMKETEVT